MVSDLIFEPPFALVTHMPSPFVSCLVTLSYLPQGHIHSINSHTDQIVPLATQQMWVEWMGEKETVPRLASISKIITWDLQLCSTYFHFCVEPTGVTHFARMTVLSFCAVAHNPEGSLVCSIPSAVNVHSLLLPTRAHEISVKHGCG
eukprot:COSAG02_NODE_68_length_42582_cov_52.351129_22_plen_147_part_00